LPKKSLAGYLNVYAKNINVFLNLLGQSFFIFAKKQSLICMINLISKEYRILYVFFSKKSYKFVL